MLLWTSVCIKYAGMWRGKSVSDQAMEGRYRESPNGPRSGDALGICSQLLNNSFTGAHLPVFVHREKEEL